MSVFSQRLRMALIRAEMKQAELADQIGAPRSAVSQYLSGKHMPDPGRLQAMAQALGCTAAFLQGEDSAPEPQPLLLVKNISTAEAARCMGKSNQFIREGLKRGTLPFGAAVPGVGVRFNYYISPARFRDFVGPEVFDQFFFGGDEA